MQKILDGDINLSGLDFKKAKAFGTDKPLNEIMEQYKWAERYVRGNHIPTDMLIKEAEKGVGWFHDKNEMFYSLY